ncbi:hypothetical protein OEG84_25300 [Hoeflea sp. G2-23]|uniref:Uncharacterized protein n=1 Tax=Hoeflea algicola TaxID=2983763 RepID=A0ABT3ZGJ0_9HYPH|nr:hypothetical protein [Hoeflea algicola]MCY0150926.1 hypothetical protein [Hoeflea algicola]
MVDIIPPEERPITLAEACREFFNDKLKPSSLRTEAKKGNLEIIPIAGKDFVTPAGIKGMIEKCRVKKSQQGSGSKQPEPEQKQPEPGTSKTEPPVSPQDALNTMLTGPKPPCKRTSPPNTDHQGTVVPIR